MSDQNYVGKRIVHPRLGPGEIIRQWNEGGPHDRIAVVYDGFDYASAPYKFHTTDTETWPLEGSKGGVENLRSSKRP